MERVAFLLEESGARLECLLNPETLVVQRVAGIQPLRSMSGPVAGRSLRDNPLLYTGGGTTTLELDLLFDVTLAGSSIVAEDVKELTTPFLSLAENSATSDGLGRPPMVRFIWGKSWNIPGVVTAVAERFEFFTSQGIPRRSWLRMRFVRVQESTVRRKAESPPPENLDLQTLATELPLDQVDTLEVQGAGAFQQGTLNSTARRAVEARRDVDRAEATVEAAVDAREQAAADLAQQRQQVAQAEMAVREAEEQLEAARAQQTLAQAESQQRTSVEAAVDAWEQAAAGLSQARQEVVQAETAVREAEEQLEAARAQQTLAREHYDAASKAFDEARTESQHVVAQAQSERLDEIAQRYYGNAAYWRLLAVFNNIDDPLHIPPGFPLRIPSLAALKGRP